MAIRYIPDIPVERAQLRWTATYAVHPRVRLGVEWNPAGEDIGPLANIIAVTETSSRPALILGTSSDRIGTPRGRAFFATLSKDIEQWTDLPVAPYVGVSYGQFDDQTRPIGGLLIRWSETVSSIHSHDGVNVHSFLEWDRGELPRLGLVLAEQDGSFYTGVTIGTSF